MKARRARILILSFFLSGSALVSAIERAKAGKLPDLVVETLQVPEQVPPGSDIGPRVRLAIKNVGHATAAGAKSGKKGYVVDLVLSRDSVPPQGSASPTKGFREDGLLGGGRVKSTPDLKPGAVFRPTNLKAVIPANTPPGGYYVCATIDPGNRIAESDEKKNTACRPIRVAAQSKAGQQKKSSGKRTAPSKSKVLDVRELRDKRIDPKTLPDSQRIRLMDGQLTTMKLIRKSAAETERKMKAASQRIAPQVQHQMDEARRQFLQEHLQRQSALRRRLLEDVRRAAHPTVPDPDPFRRDELRQNRAEPLVIPDPEISTASVGHGRPGDPVLINGFFFGEERGTVHFIVAPGRTLEAVVDFWSSTAVLVSVPRVEGVREYDGGFYIVTDGDRRSGLFSFRFEPELHLRTLPAPNRWTLGRDCRGGFGGAVVYNDNERLPGDAPVRVYRSQHPLDLVDCEGRDTFYMGERLVNGWTVRRIAFYQRPSEPGEANASLRHEPIVLGTLTDPSFEVEWWVSPSDGLFYWAWVEIVGPKGVPYIGR